MTVRTAMTDIKTRVEHQVAVPICCPVTRNPKAGSTLRISYRPHGVVLPVELLAEWVAEYVGGHEARSVRNMEELVQDIAKRASAEIGVRVFAKADLIIDPMGRGPNQGMTVFCVATP